MDQERVDRARDLLRKIVGEGGTYVLLISKSTLQNENDAQVWSEGNHITARGLLEVGKDFLRKKGQTKDLKSS